MNKKTPQKSTKENYGPPIPIRWLESDLARILARAKREGLDTSPWIRKKIVDILNYDEIPMEGRVQMIVDNVIHLVGKKEKKIKCFPAKPKT